MSPSIWSGRGSGGKVIQARSMPPGRVCPCPLRDELKRATQSNTRAEREGREEGARIDEAVNGPNNSDVTALLLLTTTAAVGRC